MSQSKNRHQAERWLSTAEEDLRAAETLPTRYPNGLPDFTPGQVYRQGDAERGIQATRMLVQMCRKWLKEAE